MPFVKLDTRILDSTLWVERECRELFITALLMAEPLEIKQPVEAIKVNSLEPLGFNVPPGWYGFVAAAGPGIARRALVSLDDGMKALEKLCGPDPESRCSNYEGRRMARVDGGYVILNYMRYRDKDHTAAERQKRMRERRKHTVTPLRNVTGRNRDVTSHIADADADADVKRGKRPPSKFTQDDFDQRDWRLIASAKKVISDRMRARVGCDESITDEQFYIAVAEESGVPVKRVMELQKKCLEVPNA